MARSEKFRAMLMESGMKESIAKTVHIVAPDVSTQTYRLLIQWMYEGECDMTGCTIEDTLGLLRLSDEYLLFDLIKVTEDHIIENLDGFSSLNVLTQFTGDIPLQSEQNIKDAAKSVLLDDYELVESKIPDIEEKIAKVKGLMSDLFTFKLKKKKSPASSRKQRKGTIVIDDAGSKKKVRFNISSTIYEEASAIIHDESDSMIEPLSIYSNSSPPGELAIDIIGGGAPSSTRSLSMPMISERRNSE